MQSHANIVFKQREDIATKKRLPTCRSSVSSARLKLGFRPGDPTTSMLVYKLPPTSSCKKFGVMDVPEVKRFKSLEEVKKLHAEPMLDKDVLQVALGRKFLRQTRSG